jgi:hypothetical protein
MAMRRPITVYLDTQDYSRFGKVIAAGSRTQDAEIFERLKTLRSQGLARFVYAVPILSELLQYEPEYERETLAKAQAVEELCGGSALIWLPRLIESQANAFGRSIGLSLPDVMLECIRSENEWFPRISGQLNDFKDRLQGGLDGAAAKFGPLNRAQRRAVGANKRDGKLIAATRTIAPQVADKYGIPVRSVERAILPLLQGKCSGDEASRLLFGAVAQPTAFVHVFFKVQKREKTLLNFIGKLGEKLGHSLLEFRRQAEPLLASKQHVDYLRSLIRADVGKFSKTILGMVDTDEAEQGVNSGVLQAIIDHPAATSTIPCLQIAIPLLLGYLEQTVAVLGTPSKVERGFGGDLIHALYLDCVDIWRSDGRFSELVRQRLPDRADKVQPSLPALPDHIVSLAEKPA